MKIITQQMKIQHFVKNFLMMLHIYRDIIQTMMKISIKNVIVLVPRVQDQEMTQVIIALNAKMVIIKMGIVVFQIVQTIYLEKGTNAYQHVKYLEITLIYLQKLVQIIALRDQLKMMLQEYAQQKEVLIIELMIVETL